MLTALIVSSLAPFFIPAANAAPANGCAGLPSHEQLKTALTAARKEKNGGMNNDMWGALVDRNGVVCEVAFTGAAVGDQWPGSRLIAAEKANTANSFSLPLMALSTANLYGAVQPGSPLYGIAAAQPADPVLAAKGETSTFGTEKDPLIGERLGGVITFGGGLAVYDKGGKLLGALGVSGDSSCADHNIAWRTRQALELDYVPAGVAKDKSDQITYDFRLGKSAGGFGHPECGKDEQKVAKSLGKVRTVGKSDGAK